MNNLHSRAFRSALPGTLAMAVLLFVPAGTLAYWQGWAFLATFVASTAVITVYLAIKDPALLERRMKAGPREEKEPAQRIIVLIMMIGFVALFVFPALGYRFQWSPVPAPVSIIGDALIVLGFLRFLAVFRVNSYGASTIQIEEGQTVISTGPYALVRHPMYAGALPLLIGIPLALGSWWGLFALVLIMPVLVWRLTDEERFLAKNLAGYTEYMQRVRYRLIQFVW